MKRPLLLVALLAGIVFGCQEDTNIAAVANDGLSLYWDHEIFGEEGRRFRFEFSSQKALSEQYQLVFQKTITGNVITVRLTNTTSQGPCQPFPGDKPSCISKGGFSIPETDLPPGPYTINLITPSFTESGQLTITSEKAVLDLGANKQFTSSIEQVFPIPRQLLFGSIVYTGSDKTQAANNLIAYLSTLGVTPVTLPDHPYRHLSREALHLATKDWPEDNHMISLLYSMKRSFRDIVGDLKRYVDQTGQPLSIYLYSSLGGEVRLGTTDPLFIYGSDQ
ncbi:MULTISPECIES: hypothetical protein [unclassified Spirosoma]|uniref:hypothetical protein n=1 Tax=unclassified Spirosoma TaxID=2621999 RepID=UPI0009609C6D|nr:MULTISPECIES: hypothetical protein [unclassified Spirosoma]MBN8825550.1 hypothetical protein [Spirosoma sp.]OJW74201.1 MAG: hypothetical protein BGO59_13870 [Spirosoma sp. 48-14]